MRLDVTPEGSRLRIELDDRAPEAPALPPEITGALEELRARLELLPAGLLRVTHADPTCDRARALLFALALPIDAAPARPQGTRGALTLELDCGPEGPAVDLTLDHECRLLDHVRPLIDDAPQLSRVDGLRELATLRDFPALRLLRQRGEFMALALVVPRRLGAWPIHPANERVAAYVAARAQRSAGGRQRELERQTHALLELTRPYSHIASTLARVVVARRFVELDLEQLFALGGAGVRRCAELLGSLWTLDDVWERARRCESVEPHDDEAPALIVLLAAATLELERRRDDGMIPPARWAEVLPHRLAITRAGFYDAAERFDAALGDPPAPRHPPEQQVALWVAVYRDWPEKTPRRALVEYLRPRDPARAELLERAIQMGRSRTRPYAFNDDPPPPRPPAGVLERVRRWFTAPAPERAPEPTPPPPRDGDWLGPLMADKRMRASPMFPNLPFFAPNLSRHAPPGYATALAEHWMLAGLQWLNLEAPICAQRLAELLRSPYLRGVTTITIHKRTTLSPASIAALLAAESLSSVTALHLSGEGSDPTTFVPSGHERWDDPSWIYWSCIDAAHLERLLAAPAIARIRRLAISCNNLPSEAAELLIDCPRLDALEQLDVIRGNFKYTRSGDPAPREQTIARLVQRFGARLALHGDDYVQRCVRDHG